MSGVKPFDLPGVDWSGGAVESVLKYVREATLPGIRGLYDSGGAAYRPIASLFYADRVRMVPYEANSLVEYMADLRKHARTMKAVGAAVVVGSDAGVLVVLEHRDLAQGLMWWASLHPAEGGVVRLGEWEQRPGHGAGTGPWSVLPRPWHVLAGPGGGPS